jgi:hypothetical protein
MKWIVLALAVAAGALIAGCKSSSVSSSKKEAPIMIKLVTYSCFGRCKEFELSIFENRRMLFHGKRHVENMGNFEGELSKEGFQSIKQILSEIEKDSLAESYLHPARDLQKMELQLGAKQIRFHRRRLPDELVKLVDELFSIVENSDWKLSKD